MTFYEQMVPLLSNLLEIGEMKCYTNVVTGVANKI